MSAEASNKNKPRSAVLNMVFTAMFAAVIALCSIIAIPVGEIPVTLQTLAVCLTAAVLGWKRGVLSVFIYILLGAAGLPVFSGMQGGLGVLAGPTGGYIVGFLATAFIVGFTAERYGRRALPLALSMAAGVIACYAVGSVWFTVVMKCGIAQTMLTCVIPFLIPDAVKIALAVFLSRRLIKVINVL